ncbi:SRPBCC family protein [Azospirillum thermophilum]|uniref:ATPase n=1 Tax=Azospirillum thermophilum TaxID=2202148 RepID=A0A2S2CZW2_9PROT|nr:SRPBCC family protein [Azospirillum thermophilum]AWK89950.1 ATPase [Azospirillum thermophilum]
MNGFAERLSSDAVRFERLLPGPIGRVWSYLVESDKRSQWLAAGEMEPRAGVSFELLFNNGRLSPGAPAPERFRHFDKPMATGHRVLRCDPPRLLAFSWGGRAEAPSEVTIELSEEGDKVRLVLTHRRLPADGSLLTVSGGWHTHLAILADRLAGREPPALWPLFDEMHRAYSERFGAEPAVTG